ncbi:CocE/NonD family hydrolase [Streptomyces spinoverrucosus]|uniref:CocE/NonD family hydrolase n=1 Tax=Streptomyces spinoverrucosus TaxID=284043 RepID=UPI00142EB1B5|nr:CocE/NonD family hydrolase [Streptomyces spinoverrucosus]
MADAAEPAAVRQADPHDDRHARSAGGCLARVHEESDGYDTVRWAAALAGSNGSVGMIGAATSVTPSGWRLCRSRRS